MTSKEFQARTRFDRREVLDFSEGSLVAGAAPGERLPRSLLLPFHEIVELQWNPNSGSGRVVAIRQNRIDDWFYACHFLGDPVMPGCWGIDAFWQCMRFFAVWRGIADCSKELGMGGVAFSGQIRPYDRTIRYEVDVLGIESCDGETLLAGKGRAIVDGSPVYSAASVQVGTAFWQSEETLPPTVKSCGGAIERSLSLDEFSARRYFSPGEVLAISHGTLVADAPEEFGLLPSSLMLEVGEVHEITYDATDGTGRILASRRIDPTDWFFPMNGGAKPTALIMDGVWQLLGLFLAWKRNGGTGRALGFDRAEVFDRVRPDDRKLVYDVRISKLTQEGSRAGAFACADARVFSGGRLVLYCFGARVGCRRGIRYSDYPLRSGLAFGGALKTGNQELGGQA